MTTSHNTPKEIAAGIVYDFGERVVLAHDPEGDEGIVTGIMLEPHGIEYRVRWNIATHSWHTAVEITPSMQLHA